MKVVKFGTIREVDGDIVIQGFIFDAEASRLKLDSPEAASAYVEAIANSLYASLKDGVSFGQNAYEEKKRAGPYPAWLDLTPEQRAVLMDRARKHRSLLHNQPQVTGNSCVDESEIILDLLLRRYSIIRDDEQIEEIAAIVPEHAEGWGKLNDPYLSITTNLQVIELPYSE